MSKVLIIAVVCVLLVSGCLQKAVTPPYSEVIKEAENRGIKVPTVEEEREKIAKLERENNERLISIISARAKDSEVDKEYRIGASDEIQISVFDVPELNLTAQVKETGELSLPLIGSINAKGQTEESLLNEITRRLKGFVISPQVALNISNYGSSKVAVVGAVHKPGNYPLKKGANNILELISEAGGLNDKAGNTLNFVTAEMSGMANMSDAESRARFALNTDKSMQKNSGVEISLDNILGTAGTVPLDIPIKGGDMIIIPEAGKVMVEGEVFKVGMYDLGRQMSLLSALAAAGGISYGAKIDEVEIIRDIGSNQRAHLIVDLQKISSGEEQNYRLKNGDIVKVPSHSGRRLRQDTFESITRLINFGVGGSVNMSQ
jgi:polysaccharide export outer membrane protein